MKRFPAIRKRRRLGRRSIGKVTQPGRFGGVSRLEVIVYGNLWGRVTVVIGELGVSDKNHTHQQSVAAAASGFFRVGWGWYQPMSAPYDYSLLARTWDLNSNLTAQSARGWKLWPCRTAGSHRC
jgi:hypothetical protein